MTDAEDRIPRTTYRVTGEDAISANAAYHFMTALVVPRPIAWISTVSARGIDNLAPHSFYTVSCRDPAIVQFTSVGLNHTLSNILETKEFVINVAPMSLATEINMTATDYPADLSEFDEVGLTREPSIVVSPPRVAESPAALECTLRDTVHLGDSWVVFGDLVAISVKDEILDSYGERVHPDFHKIGPAARLGRDEWGLPGEVQSIPRIKWSSANG